MSLELIDQLGKNPFVLAPMAGITDSPFRSFMREMGASLVITELVSVTGLQFNSDKTLRLMAFDSSQRPVGIQIFGYKLEHFTLAARKIQDLGADFVDLNLGCPVNKIVKKGGGAALLKDVVQLKRVLRAVKNGTDLPVTIKVRTGWDEGSRNSEEIAQIAYDEGILWMGIHGRTRSQAYSGKADWDYIKKVSQNSPIPVLGNGDIFTGHLAQKRMKESGCRGVMVGRGCLKNPWIFQEAQGQTVTKDFVKLFKKLVYHLENHYPEKKCQLQLKKLSCWYSSGYPGGAEFRKSIFQCQSFKEVHSKAIDFFAPLSSYLPKDTSHQPFLMGGHG